jgi:hypothetical protein
MSGVEVIELVSAWLRSGRITADSDAIGNFACHEYVEMVSAIRSVRRWDTVTSTRMLVAVHAGRSAWLLSSHRMVRSMQNDAVADLMERRAEDALVIGRLTASETDLQQRVDALEDEVLDFMRASRELEVQVLELRAALADVRRAR